MKNILAISLLTLTIWSCEHSNVQKSKLCQDYVRRNGFETDSTTICACFFEKTNQLKNSSNTWIEQQHLLDECSTANRLAKEEQNKIESERQLDKMSIQMNEHSDSILKAHSNSIHDSPRTGLTDKQIDSLIHER